MPATAIDNKQFIRDYFADLCSQPKTEAVIDRWVSDPHLKQHILEAEAAFPGYVLSIDDLVAENDTVALRSTMTATHKGTFAGIPATGKHITTGVMLFYRIEQAKIAQFWMQLDVPTLMAQLTS